MPIKRKMKTRLFAKYLMVLPNVLNNLAKLQLLLLKTLNKFMNLFSFDWNILQRGG